MISIKAAFMILTAALGGPLDPPAGPIAPTPGPEPRIAINAVNTPGNSIATFIINQPGSYYLEGNVVGDADKHGIHVTASNVTIDMMGFRLLPSDPGTASHGVWVVGKKCTIRNGTVFGWSGRGINAETSSGLHCEHVRALGNNFQGIRSGTHAVISHCEVSDNLSNGITAGDSALVHNCIASGNNSFGISTGNGSVVRDCTSESNGNTGIGAGVGSVVSHCTSRSNGGYGISGNASNVTNCVSSLNGTHGIYVVGGGSLIQSNVCAGNGTTGTFAGIRIAGNRNVVEDNVCTDGDYGIHVTLGSNIIRRNACGNNTTANWRISAGNYMGPIVAPTGNVGTVTGDTAPGTITSDHPAANITLQ